MFKKLLTKKVYYSISIVILMATVSILSNAIFAKNQEKISSKNYEVQIVDYQNQINNLKEQIEKTQEKIKELQAEISKSENNEKIIQTTKVIQKERIDNARIDELEAKVNDTRKKTDEIQKEKEDTAEKLSDMAEKIRSLQKEIEVLTSKKDENSIALKELNNEQRQLTEEMIGGAATSKIVEEKEQYEKRKKDIEIRLNNIKMEIDNLSKEYDEQTKELELKKEELKQLIIDMAELN